VDGAGFAPGADVLVQELTCPAEPCPDADAAGVTQALSDGRVTTRLTLSVSGAPHTLVAWERGWLPEQLRAPPTVAVPAQPGAGLGYPLSTRSGTSSVDTVLAAIASRDAAGLAALIQPHDITRGDGSTVNGIGDTQ